MARRVLNSILVIALTLSCTGCQSLQPFAQRTRENIIAARQFANGGLEAFQCGQLQRARGFFQRATEQRPDDFRSRANLARTLDQSGELSGAIVQMQQAVEQSGNDPQMLVELGEMYLRAGQYLPALRQAQEALKEDHQLASAWHLKGKVSSARGELESALSEYQKAAGLDRNNLELPMQIASTYQQLGEPLKALAAVENLLARYPVDSQPEFAVLTKSELLLNLKQNASAIMLLEQACQLQPNSHRLLAKLGQAQWKAGRLSEAKSTLAKGRQQFGLQPEFQNLAAEIAKRPESVERLVAN